MAGHSKREAQVLHKLSRQTLAEQAVESLQGYIEETSLQPGDVLPSEAILAARLGVSRPVIREALKALVGRSVIEIVNGKGAIIKPVGSGDLSPFFRRAVNFDHNAVRELLEVRQGLEVQAARIAASLRTDDEIVQLEEILAQMREHLFEAEMFIEADLAFHLCIASITYNSILRYLVESIREAMRGTMLQWHYHRHTPEEHERVFQLHAAITSALKAGDPVAAADAMTDHFVNAIAHLRESGSAAPPGSST